MLGKDDSVHIFPDFSFFYLEDHLVVSWHEPNDDACRQDDEQDADGDVAPGDVYFKLEISHIADFCGAKIVILFEITKYIW